MERFFRKPITKEERAIGYFSMEIGLDNRIPTYSGGLGILAGDTIKSAADLNVPMVAVTLLYEKGYFYQKLSEDGQQSEEPVEWTKENFLSRVPEQVTVTIEGRTVRIGAWEMMVEGVKGFEIPVLFLDTDIDGNSDYDRTLTAQLYGGDTYYRFCQEMVLGIGGLRMLETLGYTGIRKYHMNEGHASFLAVELFGQLEHEKDVLAEVRRRCVFTTHTPVPAGHDKFPAEMVKRAFPDFPFGEPNLLDAEGKVNMTLLALHFSEYVNGVAKKHGEVSREMFPGYPIHSITNGIHSATWVSPAMEKLFDKHIPGWTHDSYSLRYALGIPGEEIWKAHQTAKQQLIDRVNEETNEGMSYDVFTIGFARRATSYKRADLLFHDIDWLKAISTRAGKIQIIYAGKAHAKDGGGKDLIRHIFSLRDRLGTEIKLAYLENYDMALAKMLVSGVDVWLNTPKRPLEASGTSGMKAAVNGVPSFSVLDGWWLEGCIENMTGWSIGPKEILESQDEADAKSLYEKLERVILPTFYSQRDHWIAIMKHAIGINASFFNTQRMVSQYVLKAYFH